MRLRSSLGLALISLASMAPAAPAYAHAKLMSTSPAAGRAGAPPTTVRLHFDDVVQLPPGALRITGPRGNAVAVRGSLPDARTLEGSLPRNLGAGRYVVRWRVVADDGHLESGTFRFAVRVGAKRPPGAASLSSRSSPPSSRGGGDATVILTLALSLVTIVALAVGMVRLRRERIG
jgi:methionine-rich copper-binding protein CopC